jgi:hypothetical protein
MGDSWIHAHLRAGVHSATRELLNAAEFKPQRDGDGVKG